MELLIPFYFRCFFSLKKWCMCCFVAQLCPILCDPMDCSLPSTSVHEILQAGILEWGTMPSSRRSSKPQGRTQVYCIAGGFFTVWATQEAQEYWSGQLVPSPGECSQPRNKTGVSCIAGGFFPSWAAREAGSDAYSLPNRVIEDVATYYQEQMRGTAHEDFTPPTIQLHFSGSFCYWSFANT